MMPAYIRAKTHFQERFFHRSVIRAVQLLMQLVQINPGRLNLAQ